MKSKNGVKTGIVVLVLLLAIGFAAVTTQLFINGTINIGPDSTDFETNVKFYEASATGAAQSGVTGDANASASLSSDKKSITFTTQILDSIGEQSVLTFSVDNQSTYDAKLGDMKCSLGNEYNENTANTTLTTEYVSIVSTNELLNVVVPSGKNTTQLDPAKTGTVVVTQTKSYAGESAGSVTFTCRMTATGQEAA